MEKPIVCSAVIVNDDQECLFIRRARPPFENDWALVSGIGGSKKGLPPEEAVRDEVSYDLGTDFEGELVFEYPLQGIDYADKVCVFLGRVTEKLIRLNPEAATEYKWFDRQEIEKEEHVAFDDKWVIKQIRKRLTETT